MIITYLQATSRPSCGQQAVAMAAGCRWRFDVNIVWSNTW